MRTSCSDDRVGHFFSKFKLAGPNPDLRQILLEFGSGTVIQSSFDFDTLTTVAVQHELNVGWLFPVKIQISLTCLR